MSEPSSFFLRVSIDKPQLERFLQAAPDQPAPNRNWEDWWNTRKMVGKSALTDDLRAWDDATNQGIVDGWLAAEEAFAFSDYDDARREWRFGIIFCSENYGEILPLLVFCQSLQPYRNQTAPDDFGVIYPFFWGDSDVMVYMTYDADGFKLDPKVMSTKKVPKDRLDYAADRLREKWQAFEANIDYDDD